MQQLRQQDIRTVLKFLPELYMPRAENTFQRYLVSALPKIVSANIAQFHPGNALNFPMPAPITYPDVYPIADITEILEHYFHEHPIVSRVKEFHSYGPHKLSDLISRQSFHSTNLYNRLYRHYEIEEIMGVSLSQDSPGSDVLALFRDTHFNDRETQMYELLCPHLRQAFRNARALTGVCSELAQLNRAVTQMHRGLVILNEEGRVELMTPLAYSWLAEYLAMPLRTDALPGKAERWFRAEKQKLSAGDAIPAPLAPLLAERDGKKLMIRLLSDVNGDSLILEEIAPRISPRSIRGRFPVTARESEVLYWVAEGKTNGEIGTILSMSARTVAKHLEHIYQKIGLETRTAATMLVLESLK